MKYLVLLVSVAVIYLMFIRASPMAEVSKSMAAPELAPLTNAPSEAAPLPPTNALKRPIDRTHQVLGEVSKRNGSGEF